MMQVVIVKMKMMMMNCHVIGESVESSLHVRVRYTHITTHQLVL